MRQPAPHPTARRRLRWGSAQAARSVVAAVLLAALLTTGCETQQEQTGLEDGVTLADLASPNRYTTLDDLARQSEQQVDPRTFSLPSELVAPPTVTTDPELEASFELHTPELPPSMEEAQAAAEQEAAEELARQSRRQQLAEAAVAEQHASMDADATAADSDPTANAQPDRDRQADRRGAAADDRASQRMPRRVSVRRMVFAHPEPRLSRALDMLEPPDLADGNGQVWADNGFVLGHVHRRELPLLMANLPPTLDVDVYTLHRVNRYWPLTLVDRLRGRHYINFDHPEHGVRQQQVVGGQFQMLLKLVHSVHRNRPQIFLDMRPHHRGVAADLLPRNPEDRALDGTSFDPLRLYEPLSTDRVWIIAADLPLHLPEDDPEAAADLAPQAPKLGHAMFQGQQRGRNVQMLLLITAD